ncbi:protein GVQW3 [Trichonephila clavipes]|nr:protein GVQW3 [Trichonephila clavipes]
MEQRYAIKFCIKLVKMGKETHDMIKEAYGDAAMDRSGVFEWHKLFLEGRGEIEDDDRFRRLSTSMTNQNVSHVKDLLNSDRRRSIRMIADELNALFIRGLQTFSTCGTPRIEVGKVRLQSRMWLFGSLSAALEQKSTEGPKEELLGLLSLKGQTRGEDIANTSGCKLPHYVGYSEKASWWSPAVFLAKFAPIIGPGHQYSLVDAVSFPSYPRRALLKRDLTIWLAKEVFDKL